MNKILLNCLILCCCFSHLLTSNVKFGNTQSSITLGPGGSLDVGVNNFMVDGGEINLTERGNITGRPFYIFRGTFSSFLSSSFMSGRYEPNMFNIEELTPFYDPTELDASTGVLELGFNPDPVDFDFLIANPGGLRHKLFIKSGSYLLRGQPLFFGKNDIVLEDEATLLGIGVQNTLNTNIILNGGVLYLQDDLRLGDDAILKGGGTVVFNNRRISLGGAASTWNDDILWYSALDLQLNNQTILNGTWSFVGDGQINGNGNVLDIAGGGTIAVMPFSTLRLSGVKLKGLGSGNFFMGTGSALVLSDVEIEMNANFTFDSGDVYVIGDSSVITKNHTMRFATNEEAGTKGTLTVDRVALTYDTLSFGDTHNIRPTTDEDPSREFIRIDGGGTIRTLRVESISFTSFGSKNNKLMRYAIVWPDRPMIIYPGVNDEGIPQYDINIDGNTQFIGFTDADEPLLFVEPNVHAVFDNVFFREFDPIHLQLGEGASLTWGNNSSVRLWRDSTLNYPWVFQGNTMLRGGGAILTLGEEGEIVLKGENSTLLIEGITIKDINNRKIRCEDPTSKIIFQNVKWVQNDDYVYDVGSLEVLNDFILYGNGFLFSLQPTQECVVHPDSMLKFMWGITFNYDPVSLNKNLLRLTGRSSALAFEEAIFSAPNGIQLTKGRLILTKENYAYNDGATSSADGIIYGDGISEENNLLVEEGGDSILKLRSGFIVDKSV
jgi:hypothetical protein